MCFIKNRERGSNEFSACTLREFQHTQKKVGAGGAYNVTGAIFMYIFVALLLAGTCVVCTVACTTEEDGEVDFGGNNDNYR